MTQPQGHSTSGSHERYKSKERLAWEEEHDCIKKMREWMISNDFAVKNWMQMEAKAKETAECQEHAWKAFMDSCKRP